MSMPTGREVVAALRARDLDVVEYPGWERHNRAPRAWGPLVGVLTHHTAGQTLSGAAARRYAGPGGLLWKGVPGLPGPLCQIGCDDDGVVHMIGWGRANHAGLIDGQAITEMVAGRLPMAGNRSPGADRVDGNAPLVGIENMTSRSFSPRMRRANLLIVAAFHDLMRWPAAAPRLLAHREVTRRKPEDPRMDVGAMRRDLRALLAAPTRPSSRPGAPAPRPTPTPEWSDMSTKAEIEQVVRDVVRAELSSVVGGITPPPWHRREVPDGTDWSLGTLLRNTNMQAQAAARDAAITRRISERAVNAGDRSLDPEDVAEIVRAVLAEQATEAKAVQS